MNRSPDTNRSEDDDNEIGSLLGRFKPVPTERYKNQMLSAPWRKALRHPLASTHASRKITPRIVWVFGLLLVILLVVTSLLIPQVRAIARQILFTFIPSSSNQIEIQITPSNPGDLFNFTDPSNFPLSLEDAQQQSGFSVKQIVPVPEKLSLVGARYDPDNHAVILLYLGDRFELFITQRLIGSGEDVFSIGQEATVQLVKIGNIPGEFVEGGWKAISTGFEGDKQSSENPINITAVWDDYLPQSTLRWKLEDMTYELRALGESRPSQTDLINWANELK